MWPVAAAMGVQAIGSYLGQQSANDTNVQLAREAARANLTSAREQIAFQERMSNTAFQRQVKDLKAAGINPLLLNPGGASTPSGAAANSQAATVSDPVGPAISSALNAGLQVQQSKANIGLTTAQTAKAKMETQVLRKGVPAADIKNDAYDLVKPYLKKAKEAIQDSARPIKEQNRRTLDDYNKRYKTKITLP